MRKNIFLGLLSLTLFLLVIFKDNIYSFFAKFTVERFVVVENVYESNLKKDYQDSLLLLNFKDFNNYEYLYSKILYNNFYDIKDEIVIYYGEDKGLKENMAVLNQDGLIGVIKQVSASSSVVKLITNKTLNISVIVNDIYGVLTYEKNTLLIKGINSNDVVNVGDIVYTSGLGSLTKNIPIGVVLDIEVDNLEKNLKITPFVDFDSINFVVVLKDNI